MRAGFCCVFILICGSVLGQTVSPPAAASPASSPAENAVPTFHATSRLVLVDVVVTGKHGEFVRELKPADFTVLENGRLQRISAFSAHVASDAAQRPAPQLKLPPHQYTNFSAPAPDHPITIVLMDMLNTEFLDRTYARLQMLKFLSSMPAGQPVGLFVLGSKLQMVQGFTQSSDALVAAAKSILDKNENGHLMTSEQDLQQAADMDRDLAVIAGRSPASSVSVQRALKGDQAYQTDVRIRSTLISLRALAQAVAGYPGRKNLIWLSGDFPIAFGPDFDKDSRQLNYLLYEQEVHLLSDVLASSQIAVYPIDVRGLEAHAPGGAMGVSTTGFSMDQRQTLARWNTEFTMREVAKETGGEAFFNQNDLRALMLRSLAEGTNYYTLAYVPQDHDWNGKYRKIEVKLGTEGDKLRYRNGYYAMADQSSDVNTAAHLLAAAMQPTVPESTRLLIKAQVLPSSADKKTISIDFAVNPSDLLFADGPEQRKNVIVDFMAVALDGSLKESAMASNTVDATLRPETYQQVLKTGFPGHLDLELKPGKYVVRLGAIDRNSEKIGTVDLLLTVPGPEAAQK
jgi:VWFA-related protein